MRVEGSQRKKIRREARTSATTTGQLLALRDWLVTAGIALVGMESTGVHLSGRLWRPQSSKTRK
ncbi:hypothetical protein D0Z08_05450 [Nocardioides immobilis]|uniref:Uncharacterized protein n=1 Tax=Nocardioides immobilis TaxID=2049295 RepID=A0A417Y7F6_9ACTN|nr:hypothetical protein D0Z08_05450 [Nocardioides immobilis]